MAHETHEIATDINRLKAAEKSRAKSLSLRELGFIPPCSNPELREHVKTFILFAKIRYQHIIMPILGQSYFDSYRFSPIGCTLWRVIRSYLGPLR